MKISRCGAFLILLFLASGINAQVPGFLGKKLSINLGLGFYPVIEGPSKGNKGGIDFVLDENPQKNTLGLNYSLEASVDYAIGRYNSIGLFYNQYQTGLTSRLHIPSGESIFLVYDAETFHLIDAKTIGAVYNKFKSGKGALAPIGRYTSYGIERVTIDGEITDFIVINPKGITTVDPADVQNFNHNHSFFNLLFKYMISIPLTDRILIKPGGSIRLPVNLITRFSGFFDVTEHSEWRTNNNQAYYDTGVETRIMGHGLARFEVNLAYLLF